MTDRVLDLADLRCDYNSPNLRRGDLAASPLDQLERWLGEARVAAEPDANAMALATADATGQPSVRTVLLKGLDADGLRFFTNRDSQKGRELTANPQASVCFLWHGLHRQVRASGRVEILDDEASFDYFRKRPHGSQLGAWASPQSEVLADREALEALLHQAERRFADQPIPLPDRWGGYLLRPHSFEFWQGQPSRLHDRFRYRRVAPAADSASGVDDAAGEASLADPAGVARRWIVERLAP